MSYVPVIATAACFIDAETLNRAEEKRSVNGYPFTERFLILPSLTQTSPLTRGCLARSIKTVPLFELFAHVIPVKSLFLDPVIDHIASLAVNFQGPLILDMGIETAFRFTPGTEEGLAMVP